MAKCGNGGPGLRSAPSGLRFWLRFWRPLPVPAFAQIISGGARGRARNAAGSGELRFGQGDHAAVRAHFDGVEPTIAALIHPVLVRKRRDHALDRALDPEGLAAADAAERLLLVEDARRRRGGTEVELRLPADHLLRTGRLPQPALHPAVRREPPPPP